MNKFAAILMLMTFSLTCIGNASGETMSQKALAIEYLKVSKFSEAIDSSIDAYSVQLYGDMPDAERTKLKKFMQETMGWDAIKDQLAELMTSLYTPKELKAAIAFEKSPIGASIAEKNEKFSNQFAELLSQNVQRFVRNNHPKHAAANSVPQLEAADSLRTPDAVPAQEPPK